MKKLTPRATAIVAELADLAATAKPYADWRRAIQMDEKLAQYLSYVHDARRSGAVRMWIANGILMVERNQEVGNGAES